MDNADQKANFVDHMAKVNQMVVLPRIGHTLTIHSCTSPPLLSQMFPRHVIDHMVCSGASPMPDGGDEQLTTFHEGVTVMFMDVVGFTAMSKDVQAGQVGQGAEWGG